MKPPCYYRFEKGTKFSTVWKCALKMIESNPNCSFDDTIEGYKEYIEEYVPDLNDNTFYLEMYLNGLDYDLALLDDEIDLENDSVLCSQQTLGEL